MKRETKHDRSHNKNLSTGYFRLMEERIRQLTAQGKNKAASNSRCALKHLRAYRKGQDILLADVTHLLVSEFQDYLIRKEMKLNTVSLYLRMLRAAYNYAVEEELISEDRHPFRKAFTGQEKTRKRALPPQVVGRILTVRLSDPQLEFARDLFLFSCYTGLAYIDLKNLSSDMLQRWPDGNLWIDTKRQKTNIPVHVRLLETPLRLIEKYKDSVRGKSRLLFPVPSNQKVNSYLKEIADLCGIDKDLTFHMARHTFATTITLSQGMAIETISELLGHKSVRTTQIYAKITPSKLEREMMLLSKKIDRLYQDPVPVEI